MLLAMLKNSSIKFLDPDVHVTSSSLSTDASLAKISRRPVQQFLRKVAIQTADIRRELHNRHSGDKENESTHGVQTHTRNRTSRSRPRRALVSLVPESERLPVAPPRGRVTNDDADRPVLTSR